MLTLRRSVARLHSSAWARSSSQAVDQATVKRKRKEIIVNFKYGPVHSDPLYQDLLYSTEVEVYLTAKKGKAWMEMQAAKKYKLENEQRERERAARSKPVPLALQYMYGQSQRVQREADVTDIEQIDVLQEVAGELESGSKQAQAVFPYAVYNKIVEEQREELGNEVPTEEIKNSSSRSRRGRRGRNRQTEIVEKEDIPKESLDRSSFEKISDESHSDEIREVFSEDHLFKYGTAAPEMAGATTDIPCGGCGAHLHCVDEKIPGFVPSQILAGRSSSHLRSLICQRCYFIKEYKVALKLNVSPEDYPKAIEHIKEEKALIILVVDLMDFPGSVWPGILELIGKNKKVILVGNKFDLIVPDTKKYYQRIVNIIRTEFLNKCWKNSDNSESVFPQIIGSCCLSATTGFNVEKLVEMIFNYWKNQNDALPGNIYIVGCTNVGKSSLFNLLLDSDLCNKAALNLVQKAMISPVPGTTLNLLKFPVTRPEPHFLVCRKRRLNVADVEFRRRENERVKQLSRSRNLELAVPGHYAIKHTLLDKVEGKEDKKMYSNTVDFERVPGTSLPDRLDPGERSWGKHCHDTPGTVSQDQIINMLTSQEVGRVLPVSPVRPRTLLIKTGQTLLLGGLARLDLLTASSDIHPVRLTVFCSDQLPINIVKTDGVDNFLAVAINRQLLAVPEVARPEMPQLAGEELEVEGLWGSGKGDFDGPSWRGAADIVLSSCGWVMVSPKQAETVTFRAYTPGGRGISTREPFLPNSINYRGKRILGTPAFRNNLVFIP